MNVSKELFRILLCLNLFQITLQNLINLAQGKMNGISQEGYISYIGIPYASVSGNSGRFKGPGLAPVWSGIRQSHDPQCTSTSAVEDCLELDVNVPSSGSQLPVMVWVKGSSGYYNPQKLVLQGIIVVVVRHRLGSTGFLCSKEDKIPGNAGVKDALQALRWIRDNIIAFKGNPHKVVLAGQGFGAAIVEALMLLPSSHELYHGVVLQSGSILCPWTFNYDAEDRANALHLMIKGSDDNKSSIIKTDTLSLDREAEKIEFPYMPLGICVEKPYKYEESMILETPFNLLLKGKIASVPLLMGYNSNEAYVFTSMLKEAKVISKMARDITFLLPEELQNLSDRELIQITNQIKDMYFNDNTNMTMVLLYHRDAYFLSHIHRSLRFHTKMNQPVYYYQFSYSGSIGVGSEPKLKKIGAAHSDELAYLFPQKGRDYEDDDVIVQQHLIRLWTNFVKHLKLRIGSLSQVNCCSRTSRAVPRVVCQIACVSLKFDIFTAPVTKGVMKRNGRNPTPEASSPVKWEPTGAQHPRILDINTELEMREFSNRRAIETWQDIYEKYYYTRKPNTAK